MDPDTINSIGLSLDIAGVVLLFKYGLPSDVGARPDEGYSFGLGGGPPAEERRQRESRWTRYRTGSRLGLGLLVAGFVLQIVSNHVPSSVRSAPENVSLWIFASAVVCGVWLWTAAWLAEPRD